MEGEDPSSPENRLSILRENEVGTLAQDIFRGHNISGQQH